MNRNTSKPKNINLRISAIASATTLFFGGFLFTAPEVFSRENSQLIAQSNTLTATSAQQETLYLNNDKTYSYNLVATEQTTIDGITVPAGATIVGRYVPADGGLRYEAQAVTYDQYSYSINATSQVIEDVKDPRDRSAGSIAGDAAIGAAGGAVLGEVLGDEANVEEIIGGAAAGAAVGNVTAERVVVIEPDAPITLYSN